MKKLNKLIFIIFAVLIFSPVLAHGDDAPIRLMVDGSELVNMSAPPIIRNDRTLVPVRDVFEWVGGIVGWHSVHKQVTLYYGEHVLVMTINETTANLDGNLIEMDTPPIIYNDRTMVPLRFPAEVFGFEVDWDDLERAAIVNSPGSESTVNHVEFYDDNIPHIPLPQSVLDAAAERQPPTPPPVDEFTSESDNAETPWDGTGGGEPRPGVTIAQNGNARDLARDISAAPIQTIAYAETTITTLRTPNETGSAAYMAVATFPISEVHYFLLPDNRLVVDIHNAMSLISGNFDVPAGIPVSGVRASQFSQTPKVTRIVFDVVGSAEYSVSLSADRTLLTVSFSQNRIRGVFAQSDAYADALFIQGDVLPSINISTEGFPHYITLNINNAEMDATDGVFHNGIFATHFSTGQNSDGSAFIRVFVNGTWPSFSIANNENSVAFMMHRGISGIRYDSVNRELRISKDFNMNIFQIEQINDYLRFNYSFVLPASAEVLGRGEISVLDGFVNSVSLIRHGDNIHLTFNTARVLTFSVHEEPDYYVIRAHIPSDISPFIVVIDPGHGGTAPGASHNGIIEKDLALDVSNRVMLLLEADPQITVYMTRRDDTFTSLLNRTEFSNHINADLFISIHANAAELSPGVPNTEVNGIETWYTVGALEEAGNSRIDSRRLAQIMQRHLLRETGAFDRGVRDAPDFVVLRDTNCPSVLIELGFLTNPYEASLLQDPNYRQQLAMAIYLGIVEAFALTV